ncbi:MAG: hypothetical protein H0X71_10070 [Rubrobacter sp.]|nr:hypothetical protein [Rubrobacter sp.]
MAVPVLGLGCWNAIVGAFFATIAFGVLPDGSKNPFPLVPYLAALIVVEASLALFLGCRLAGEPNRTAAILEARRRRRC